ncbi:flagellar FliJ family protein [Nocardioides jishulii]|uniref:Flagellar FliJ protein n=1 Tax=Nocardioides jishulii TaxID=2575440 RepID=A0A4U2YSS5_9ACTN|nr:flagellar FliJ family protein [Nocardioides jishulii]QCX28589.1 hypothetical protein FCL41_14390 [Nocardioides jishulii]TKI64518.1 hypothetical protein FC770_05185 [Nocardioides jishulii]
MSARNLDRGMRAVERVRAVRERDSRIGLQQALAEREQRRARLADLNDQLASSPAWDEGDATSFRARRAAVLAIGAAAGAAGDQLGAAHRIADSAQAHWSTDKTRLAAVESLLARRAEVRRGERAHREAVELDDIAAQLWGRAQRVRPAASFPTTPASSSATPTRSPLDPQGAR